jgi:hypothetical protein
MSIESGAGRGKPRATLDTLMIVCCLPVVVISAIVLIIAGGVELGFLIPAIVCGAMIGMLMFVSIRDRTTI